MERLTTEGSGTGDLGAVLNVRDFGAVGDGLTDDTVAIQTAIDQASDAGRGTVLIPNGLYLISAALTIAAPFITIRGPGKLFKKASTKTFTLKITAPWVEIDGLQIDGNRAGQSQGYHAYDEIRLEDGASNCRVIRCRIENSAGSAVAGYACGHNVVAYNQISNCNDGGIFFGGAGSDYNQILYNDVEGTTRFNGIFVTASPGSFSTPNYIYHNTIIGNVVKGAGDTCIESGIHAVSTIISLNRAINSRKAAILVRDNQFTLVQDNFVDMTNPLPPLPDEGDLADGIAFYAQEDPKDPERDGTWPVPNAYSLCVGNLIHGGRFGIHIGGHDHITLNGNAIYNPRQAYIQITEAHFGMYPRHINRVGQVQRGFTVPLKQFADNLVLALPDEIGLVTLQFGIGGRKEYAILYVYPEAGDDSQVGYKVIECSRSISTNPDRFEGWAILRDDAVGYIVLQRRGPTLSTSVKLPYVLTFAGSSSTF